MNNSDTSAREMLDNRTEKKRIKGLNKILPNIEQNTSQQWIFRYPKAYEMVIISVGIREMQIKTMIRYYYKPTGRTKIKTTNNTRYWQDGKHVNLRHCGWKYKFIASLCKHLWWSLLELRTFKSWPGNSTPGLYPIDRFMYSPKDMYKNVHYRIICSSSKQRTTQCPTQKDKWILVCSYNGINREKESITTTCDKM